jgi:MinD superfamily P-loop ATPase
MRVKISVSGGKGGTGKSTVATNLAVLLARERELVLADLDAEAPNDHILLGARLENEEPVKIMVPKIIYNDCIKCGACAQVCDTGAIIMGRDNLPFLLPRLCSGCRACYFVCPTKAIVEENRIIGYTYQTTVSFSGEKFSLVTGVLSEGEEHTPPVVIAARDRAASIAKDILLVDTAAGTASHVASAIEDSKLLIAVTEPTPLGAHDLELILKLCETMGIEPWIVVNRSGIGPEDRIVDLSRKYNAKIVARIPYSKELVGSYVEGKPVVKAFPESSASKAFFGLYEMLKEVI